MVAEVEVKTEKESLLEQCKDSPYEWAIRYLFDRYGESKVFPRNTVVVPGLSVGIPFGSQLTKKGEMFQGILLEAKGQILVAIDQGLQWAAGYSLNSYTNKELALERICDNLDEIARHGGFTIPVGKKNGTEE